MELKDVVSFWGAILATVLGIIKIWETYRDRNRLETTHWWDGRNEEGWRIFLFNLGKNTVSISYYELFCSRRRFWSKRQFMEDLSPGAEGCELSVAPGEKATLHFAEESNFSREDCNIPGGHLYIRLTIVGQKRKRILLVD